LVSLLKFLSARWSEWESEGRPLIAQAYEPFMYEAVQLTTRVANITFQQVSERVGRAGGWFEPILRKIWPDWKEEQKERVRLTLKTSIASHGINDIEIDAFVEFLAQNGLEAFSGVSRRSRTTPFAATNLPSKA
jgi:hypothetical protein